MNNPSPLRSHPFFALTLRFAAACALLAPLLSQAGATLKVGDPAPALTLKKFVKGEPVKAFEKGKVYVVEFWATWCAPCRESIPHLTELQKVYPGITFIGVDVGETEKQVEPFVAAMGDKMNYRVALDDLSSQADGATNQAFMVAADQSGIPTAFIVDQDSRIAWIDHPMALPPVLARMAAGTFDAKKDAAARAEIAPMQAKVREGDFDGAIKILDELIAADPAKSGPLGLAKVQILSTYKKDPGAAAKLAEEIGGPLEDAEYLNDIAWFLVIADNPPPATMAIAQKLSEKCVGKVSDCAEFIDTLARIHALQNDFSKAIELETEAIGHSNALNKAVLTATLEAYQAGKIPAA